MLTKVSPYAQGKRLTVHGWWTGPDRRLQVDYLEAEPERLEGGPASIEIY